jgi:hypothetical protein
MTAANTPPGLHAAPVSGTGWVLSLGRLARSWPPG